MKYEEMMQRLSEITELLKNGKLSLEEAAALYTEGMQLSAKCHEILQNTVLSVQEMTVPKSGNEGTV